MVQSSHEKLPAMRGNHAQSVGSSCLSVEVLLPGQLAGRSLELGRGHHFSRDFVTLWDDPSTLLR